MKSVGTNIIVLLMAVTYILLAIQAEIVTAILGYVFGSLMALALLRQTWLQSQKGDE